jgi:hypothetical protein
VGAGGEKFREAVLRFAKRIGTHDARDIEAVRARDVVKGGLEAVAVV